MLTVLLLSMSCFATCSAQDDWWYDLGHDWDTSDHFNSYNPLYQTFKQVKAQLDMYGYAKHIGKINRGQFLNPELTRPGDRAYGYKPDFNPTDINSGAFRYKPKGQRFRAKPVHVNAGLAGKVGEIATMPIGQYVQNDGSVLVQTSKKQSNPCSPNPCMNNFPRCEEVLDGTAKCSRSETFTITFTWAGYQDEFGRNQDYGRTLYIASATHDGTVCEGYSSMYDDFISNGDEECGVNMVTNSQQADYPVTLGKDVAILETLDDGTHWEDYTHQIVAFYDDDISMGQSVLTIADDNGEVVQELQIPQYDGKVDLNPDRRYYYFFGCFRSSDGFLDTTGAGFYSKEYYSWNAPKVDTPALNTGFLLYEAGLCNALYESSGHPGFNPYHLD